MMKYKREERVKILEYKFVFEEELQVKKEYEEGSADLNYRLSFFRNKLDDKQGLNGQRDLYDKLFMGNIPEVRESSTDISLPNKQELTQSAPKTTTNIKPWAKKVYRQIVMITHPDKTAEIQSNHLRDQLTNQYRITQNAYVNEIYSDLIMVAFDLNIPVSLTIISEEIIKSSIDKKKKIQNIKNMIGWQWYHVPEGQKDAELKKILSSYGFKFTEEDVQDVIKRKRIKRKPGTRPERSIRYRRNSSKQ